jgi:hypothetical protein
MTKSLKVGDIASLTKTFTEEEVCQFAEIYRTKIHYTWIGILVRLPFLASA